MTQNVVTQVLLETKAVQLNPKDPFTFASGLISPIYCDNRLLIGYVESRDIIVNAFLKKLDDFESFDVVAGTATAGIPWAAWIADKLKKPLVYVRSSAKKHGAGKRVEGAHQDGQNVILIEDLISTGMSSLEAVQALQSQGLNVVHCLAIFEYGFKEVAERFKDQGVSYSTLTNLDDLLSFVSGENVLTDEQIELVQTWKNKPKEWGNS